MPAYTPVYAIPYTVPGDAVKTLPDTSKAQALRIESTLAQVGADPLNGDIAAILRRLNDLEAPQFVEVTMAAQGWHDPDMWVVPRWAGIRQLGDALKLNAPTDNRQILVSAPMLVLLTMSYTVDQPRGLRLQSLVNGAESRINGFTQNNNSGTVTTASMSGILAVKAGDVITVRVKSETGAAIGLIPTSNLQVAKLRSIPA